MNARNGSPRNALWMYAGCALLVAVLATLASKAMDNGGNASSAPRAALPAPAAAAAQRARAANVSANKSQATSKVHSATGSLSAPEPFVTYVAQAEPAANKTAPAGAQGDGVEEQRPAPPAIPAVPALAADEKPAAKPEADAGPLVQKTRQLDAIQGPMGAMLRRKGNLTLKACTLKEALVTIGNVWKANIVLGPDVDGFVDATFVDTPLYEILEAILTTNGYGYRITDNTLRVVKANEIGWNHPLFQTVMIPLRAASPEEALDVIKTRQSEQGQAKMMAASKTILVSDFPDRIDAIYDLVKKFDAQVAASSKGASSGVDLSTEKRQTQQFELKNAKLSLIAQPLQDALKPILSDTAHLQLLENELA